MTETNARKLLRRARSDLADTQNKELLKKYPHLDSEEFRTQLQGQIRSLEEQVRNDS